jgi:hypothetical protein
MARGAGEREERVAQACGGTGCGMCGKEVHGTEKRCMARHRVEVNRLEMRICKAME